MIEKRMKSMIDQADNRFLYRSPDIKVIPVRLHAVLCQSSMYERELNEGDFEQQ